MKKIVNRFGFVMVIAYILILIVFIVMGLLRKSKIEYYYCVLIIWVTVMAILIPVTLYKTLLLVLPNQHVRAKVVSKNISERLSNESSTTDLYLTLEYQDGTQKTFAVGIKAFNSVAMNDEGTLVYR